MLKVKVKIRIKLARMGQTVSKDWLHIALSVDPDSHFLPSLRRRKKQKQRKSVHWLTVHSTVNISWIQSCTGNRHANLIRRCDIFFIDCWPCFNKSQNLNCQIDICRWAGYFENPCIQQGKIAGIESICQASVIIKNRKPCYISAIVLDNNKPIRFTSRWLAFIFEAK